jgi:hypothetical protein
MTTCPRLPHGMGVARLADLPAEWSRPAESSQAQTEISRLVGNSPEQYANRDFPVSCEWRRIDGASRGRLVSTDVSVECDSPFGRCCLCPTKSRFPETETDSGGDSLEWGSKGSGVPLLTLKLRWKTQPMAILESRRAIPCPAGA